MCLGAMGMGQCFCQPLPCGLGFQMAVKQQEKLPWDREDCALGDEPKVELVQQPPAVPSSGLKGCHAGESGVPGPSL